MTTKPALTLVTDQAEQHVAGLPQAEQERVFALVIEQLQMLLTPPSAGSNT